MQVYLRDGSVLTIVRAATQIEVEDQLTARALKMKRFVEACLHVQTGSDKLLADILVIDKKEKTVFLKTYW